MIFRILNRRQSSLRPRCDEDGKSEYQQWCLKVRNTILQSLTVNSKKMYKLLIETQMQNMGNLSANTGPKRGTQRTGVELKLFNHLCAADFIASNEIALRSMLREFIEHKMANITKNNSGMEIIWVPYTYAELEKLLKTVLNTL